LAASFAEYPPCRVDMGTIGPSDQILSVHAKLTHQSVTKTTFLLYFPKAGATLAA
jgi:hypothetical protein